MSARIARSTRPRTSVLSFATNRSLVTRLAARFGVHAGTGRYRKKNRLALSSYSPPSKLMSISDKAQKQSRKKLAPVGSVVLRYEVSSTLPGHPDTDLDLIYGCLAWTRRRVNSSNTVSGRVSDHTDEGSGGDSQMPAENDNVLYHSLLRLARGKMFWCRALYEWPTIRPLVPVNTTALLGRIV